MKIKGLFELSDARTVQNIASAGFWGQKKNGPDSWINARGAICHNSVVLGVHLGLHRENFFIRPDENLATGAADFRKDLLGPV